MNLNINRNMYAAQNYNKYPSLNISQPSTIRKQGYKEKTEGKTDINISIQGRNSSKIYDKERSPFEMKNKIMKTCISSASQRLEKSNMRVTFYTKDLKKTEIPKVNGKTERLTKSQSNISPGKSHERPRKGKKKSPKKVIDFEPKKTSSLTYFDKIAQLKKMHHLRNEGDFKKEIITKEAIAFIHDNHQNVKSTHQKDIPQSSSRVPLQSLYRKSSERICRNIRKKVIDKIKRRKDLKTSETKYDAVILKNICVMGKQLTLWKKIKQRFDSTVTVTKTKYRSNETVTTEISKKYLKENVPEKSIKKNATSQPFNNSYLCYPLSCDNTNCKWNITKQINVDCACPKKENTSCIDHESENPDYCKSISQKCHMVNLTNNANHPQTSICNNSIQGRQNDERNHLLEIKIIGKGVSPTGNCISTEEKNTSQPRKCNRNDLDKYSECVPSKNEDQDLENQVGICGEDANNILKMTHYLLNLYKNSLLKQGKQICNKVIDTLNKNNCPCEEAKVPKALSCKQVNKHNMKCHKKLDVKICHMRSVKTQVTVKNDQEGKTATKHTCECDINFSKPIQAINRPRGLRHKSNIQNMSGDGPAKSRKPQAKFKKESSKKIPKIRGKSMATQTPKNLFCDLCKSKVNVDISNQDEIKHISKSNKSKHLFKRRRRSYSSVPVSKGKKKKEIPVEKKIKEVHKKEKDLKKPPKHKRISPVAKKSRSNEVSLKKVKIHTRNMVTNYKKISLKTRKRSKKKKKPKKNKSKSLFDDCDKLYVKTLRRKPCFCMYYICPGFYPHCLSFLALMEQTTRVFLFMLALAVWSPCLLALQMFKCFMCSFVCCD